MSAASTQWKTLLGRHRWVLPALVAANVVFAAINLVLVWALPRAASQNYFALLLVAIGGVYAGVAAIRDRAGIVVIEASFFVLMIVVALMGAQKSLWWLVAGYFAHGLWDLLHLEHQQAKPFGTRGLPVWYPPVCVIYDWLAGALLAVTAAGAIH